jgi:hypothetical protein
MAAPLCADADAQSGKTAADDQNVGVNYFHNPYRVALNRRRASSPIIIFSNRNSARRVILIRR